MTGQLLLLLLLQGALLNKTLAWEVRMPKEIHGLKSSCLVIPCTYSYTSYPPTDPNRVVWYQWVSKGYPLVYDPLYPSDVIDKFRRKTSLYGNMSNRDCSLLIKNLDQSHHGEKIYAWIDPENVGWRTYKFYDVITTIFVDASPQEPTINIFGGDKTGDTITVTCDTYHSCPYSKPNISLTGIEGSDKEEDVNDNNGRWKITLKRSGVVKTERSDIVCTVTHYGDIITRATRSQNAKCVNYNITIQPELADVIEGVAKIFNCTVYHSCQKENPIISWNYNVTEKNESHTGFNSAIVSTITFLGAKEDHGKKLICTATFSDRSIATSVVLHVQLFSQTTGLYIIIPSSCVVLLICTLAGVIICKRSHRSKDVSSVSANKRFSKLRMPSPKSQQRTCSHYEDYYTNMEDLNLYGNV